MVVVEEFREMQKVFFFSVEIKDASVSWHRQFDFEKNCTAK